jgi:transcriptional regulator with XRE-family HTH domain
MAENKQIKNVIFWLISQEIVTSQEDLAQKMGYNASSFSQIVTGRKPLSKKFAKNLGSFCNMINTDYLFGKGSMLTNGNTNTNTGNGQQIIANNIKGSISADNRQYYSDSPDVLRAQIDDKDRLLQEKEARIKEKDAQIKEKDAQINKLLSILSNN